MPLAENVSLLSSTEQLLWWLRPALCIMKLMFSRSCVAQSACYLLKALKAKLLIITEPCSVHFTLHCILLGPSLLFLLSPWVTAPRGNEGGNCESLLGVRNGTCVCVCKCTDMCLSCVKVWFSGVGCETRAVGRNREEQQQHDRQWKAVSLLWHTLSSPFALGEVQQLHLQST